MLKNLPKRSRRLTVGADKAYDVAGLVSVCLELNVHPHVIQGNKKPTQRHRRENHGQVGYGIGLGKLWLVGKAFGWLKQTRPLCKIREPSGWELARGGGALCFLIR